MRVRCPRCSHRFTLVNRQAAQGGKARAAALSPEQRRAIAINAARARWLNHTKTPK